MKPSIYKSYDELPLMLNMKQLSDLLGISDASAYELVQERTSPLCASASASWSPRRNCGDGSPRTRREDRNDGKSEARCEEVFLHAP